MALLDATLALFERAGYWRVTVDAVAGGAGLSVGAFLYHFGKKANLVSAAVAELASRRVASLLIRIDRSDGSLEAVLDALWRCSSDPEFVSALEVSVAARTDDHARAVAVTTADGWDGAAREALLRASRAAGREFPPGYASCVLAAVVGMTVAKGAVGAAAAEREWALISEFLSWAAPAK